MARRCSKCGRLLFDFEKDHVCPQYCGKCPELTVKPYGHDYAPYCLKHLAYLEGRTERNAEICEACEKEKRNEADQI